MADEKPIAEAGGFEPEVLALFDKYVHGVVDGRAFLQEAAQSAWKRAITFFNGRWR